MSREAQLIIDHRTNRVAVSRIALKLSLAFLLSAGGAALSGCSTATSKIESKYKVGVPVSKVYYAKYEEVEAAVKQAMIRYPQRVDNTEAGIFETDYVKGNARFVPAHKEMELSSGYRYRLLIRLVKGKSDERSAVRVSVLKQIELVRDFFSTAEAQPSDGLEEEAILYRINREISIAKAIIRSTEKANSKTSAQ